MKVKLIDGLELGDLEEEACGRRRGHEPTDANASWPGWPGWRVESSGEP